ncbi:uncharacterized protein N7443_006053 [Penicillium atrosanguineum]|uniref:uncharacterized protein n=1 Tax=Penicillium atrosanguineum TaxID=1132637 RepID=UPI002381DE5E|nr:uncharacterized protein N7443_006053 [Penicillium atrosanguineum]KAJ5301051.1 hypothetical protein N7443_006053 [Penicillium atrosanguineum]
MNIADIATGTGIWLNEVQTTLGDIPVNKSRYYHGFDISDAQFPFSTEEVQYSIQDALSPFPAQHLNRYDLVHVRLLVGAIQASDFEVIVANLMKLLRPQGYLQWTEIDIDTFLEGNTKKYPEFADMVQPIFSYAERHTMSTRPSEQPGVEICVVVAQKPNGAGD